MKTKLNIIVLAVLLLAAPSPCFAVWDILQVSKEDSKKLGLQVRSRPAGPNHVSVELEIKTEGNFKVFNPENKLNDSSRVDLCIGQADSPQVTAALREDRSKPGRVVVGFTVDRVQLDQANLRLIVPYSDGAVGGAHYRLRVKDFVELKKVP